MTDELDKVFLSKQGESKGIGGDGYGYTANLGSAIQRSVTTIIEGGHLVLLVNSKEVSIPTEAQSNPTKLDELMRSLIDVEAGRLARTYKTTIEDRTDW